MTLTPDQLKEALEYADLLAALDYQEQNDMADRAHLDLLVDAPLGDEGEPYSKDRVAIRASWDAVPVVYCDDPDAWPAREE